MQSTIKADSAVVQDVASMKRRFFVFRSWRMVCLAQDG